MFTHNFYLHTFVIISALVTTQVYAGKKDPIAAALEAAYGKNDNAARGTKTNQNAREGIPTDYNGKKSKAALRKMLRKSGK